MVLEKYRGDYILNNPGKYRSFWLSTIQAFCIERSRKLDVPRCYLWVLTNYQEHPVFFCAYDTYELVTSFIENLNNEIAILRNEQEEDSV
jgi:hypothetical protein